VTRFIASSDVVTPSSTEEIGLDQSRRPRQRSQKSEKKFEIDLWFALKKTPRLQRGDFDGIELPV
jgi:hypothetical protein